MLAVSGRSHDDGFLAGLFIGTGETCETFDAVLRTNDHGYVVGHRMYAWTEGYEAFMERKRKEHVIWHTSSGL